MSIEQTKKQLEWSRKQTAYAWSQYYELQRQEYENSLRVVADFEDKELDDEIPINRSGVDSHLQTWINDIYNKAKVKIECAVCLSRISADKLKTGKCGHNFHKNCIDEWCQQGHKKCPLCRKKF